MQACFKSVDSPEFREGERYVHQEEMAAAGQTAQRTPEGTQLLCFAAAAMCPDGQMVQIQYFITEPAKVRRLDRREQEESIHA